MTARKLLALLLLLSAQFVFSRLVTEPYPALILPSFGEAPDRNNQRTIHQLSAAVEFEDGSTQSIELDQLLPHMPVHYRYTSLSRILERGDAIDIKQGELPSLELAFAEQPVKRLILMRKHTEIDVSIGMESGKVLKTDSVIINFISQ